ncbi:Uncharacterised protein [Mycobacteroides abscessus]|nr:Uncharacterised protein [Mycobacteroides abscessus]
MGHRDRAVACGLTYLGLGGTLVGVMLASASEGLDGQRPGRQVLVWSFFCMVMFGICMILLAEAGRYHPVEAVVVSRATEVVLILILGALSWNNLRENLRPPFGVVPFAGVLDTSPCCCSPTLPGTAAWGSPPCCPRYTRW